MIFTKIPLSGNLYSLDINKLADNRGFFARTLCLNEFSNHGLNSNFIQQSISFNPMPGTIRGMHWQGGPFGEDKLVRVTRGAIFDVVVDISPSSPTFKKWYSLELSEENFKQIYIPKGFAHGFQTLLPNTEVMYQMTSEYNPGASLGFAPDDIEIGIKWPIDENILISDKDLYLPKFYQLNSKDIS